MVWFGIYLQSSLDFLPHSNAQIQYVLLGDDDLLEEVAKIAGCLDDDEQMTRYGNLEDSDYDSVHQLSLIHFLRPQLRHFDDAIVEDFQSNDAVAVENQMPTNHPKQLD